MKLRQGDISWEDFIGNVPYDASVEPHISDAYDVTNILFSSGTTGELMCLAVLSAGRFNTWHGAARSEAERLSARCSSSCIIEWYRIRLCRSMIILPMVLPLHLLPHFWPF